MVIRQALKAKLETSNGPVGKFVDRQWREFNERARRAIGNSEYFVDYLPKSRLEVLLWENFADSLSWIKSEVAAAVFETLIQKLLACETEAEVVAEIEATQTILEMGADGEPWWM